MFITPAFAQSPGATDGNFIIQLLPFLFIFVIIYMLIIRPQQRRAKEHKEMIASVKRGDTIVTAGGLVGKVTKVIDDSEVQIEIATNVKIRVVRQMISDIRGKGNAAKSADKKKGS